jgi:hypothetical protein
MLGGSGCRLQHSASETVAASTETVRLWGNEESAVLYAREKCQNAEMPVQDNLTNLTTL